MSTSAQVRAAWAAAIFAHSSITALTDKIYDYDVTLESTKEFSKLRYQTQINFMTYLVTRAQRVMMMGQLEQTFQVQIRYHKQADIAGAVFKQVSDVFETFQDLVQSQLTGNWSSTIDYYRTQSGQPRMEQRQIENLPVWVGTYDFFGVKLTG